MNTAVKTDEGGNMIQALKGKNKFFSSLDHPDQLCSPHSLLHNVYWGLLYINCNNCTEAYCTLIIIAVLGPTVH